MTTCIHLQQLVQLCQASDLRLSSSDLIHLVCKQCGKQEVCPALLIEEVEAQEAEAETEGENKPFAPSS